MNAVAGGGSFFSFPALLGLGLPPVNANATNSVALWPGQMTAVFAFREELRAVRRLLVPVLVSSVAGGILGALLLLFTAQTLFLKMVPWLLLFATVLFAVGRPIQQWVRRNHPATVAAEDRDVPMAAYFWLMLVTIYIGYFGAGAGFLSITLFTLYGITNLNQVNALKVLCATVANGVAVLTFIVAGAVYWKECTVMGLFAIAGSYLGASQSRKVNPKILRWFIIATGLILSGYYFWR